MAEADALGVTAVLTADADLQLLARRAALLDPHPHQLANAGGVPLNVRYRDFALTAAAARYPALLPSELGSTARHEILLREGVLRTGESLSAVLFFRTSPPTALLLELRVELTDVHDTPIGQAFVPILHAPASHG